MLERAGFEATNPGLSAYWQGVFRGEIPEKPETPDRLETTSIELEGSEIKVIDIGQGDTEHSTNVHVPSIRAVVGGDVVYNDVHMMTAETDAQSRQDWIDNLNQIASLDPQIVVSGHQRVGAPTGPKSLGESQQYLRDFSRVVETGETLEDIVKAMLACTPTATTLASFGTARGKPSRSESRTKVAPRFGAGAYGLILTLDGQHHYNTGVGRPSTRLSGHRLTRLATRGLAPRAPPSRSPPNGEGGGR